MRLIINRTNGSESEEEYLALRAVTLLSYSCASSQEVSPSERNPFFRALYLVLLVSFGPCPFRPLRRLASRCSSDLTFFFALGSVPLTPVTSGSCEACFSVIEG